MPFGHQAGHFTDITALVATNHPSRIPMAYAYREGDYSTRVDIVIASWRQWEDNHFPPPGYPPIRDGLLLHPQLPHDPAASSPHRHSSSSSSNGGHSEPTIDLSAWSPRSNSLMRTYNQSCPHNPPPFKPHLDLSILIDTDQTAMENHRTHRTLATENQALKSKSRQISSLINLDLLARLEIQPIPNQIIITPFFVLWIKSNHARASETATSSLSTTLTVLASNSRSTTLTACFPQVDTARDSTTAHTTHAALLHPLTKPYDRCLTPLFTEAHPGQRQNPQKPKVNTAHKQGPLPSQSFSNNPFGPPLILQNQPNNPSDPLFFHSPADSLDHHSINPLDPLHDYSPAPLCLPNTQTSDSLDALTLSPIRLTHTHNSDLLDTKTLDSLDPPDAQTHNSLQVQTHSPIHVHTQTLDPLDNFDAHNPHPINLNNTHTSDSPAAQAPFLVQAHSLDLPASHTLAPNSPNPQSFALPDTQTFLPKRPKLKTMATRKSPRILAKQKLICTTSKAPNQTKSKMSKLPFDTDSHDTPLDDSTAIAILQATGLQIDNQVRDMINRAIQFDVSRDIAQQARPLTPLHDSNPPRPMPGNDLLL